MIYYTSYSHSTPVLKCQSFSQCGVVSALNRIQSRSVSIIHAFCFASVSKQLICCDLDFSNQIIESDLKSNHDFLSQIFIVQIVIKIPIAIWICPSLQATVNSSDVQ